MPDLDRFRPVLWAAAGVCLVAALVAVPIVTDGDGGDGTDVQTDGGWVGSTSATSTSVMPGTLSADGGDGGAPVAPDGGATASGGDVAAAPGQKAAVPAGSGPSASNTPAPSPTGSPASPPPTSAPAEDLGPPTDPGLAKPPSSGTYRYKLTDRRGTRETTTVIEDRGTNGTETRQLHKIRGESADLDNEVAWRPDGVHVLSSVFTFGANKGSCDWEPDTLQLRLPAAQGTTWESTSTCSATGIGPTPIPVSRKITGRYVELRRVRIAGQIVNVWAIEGTERIEAAGRVTDRSGTTLFSPKHGLAVSSSGTYTDAEGPAEYRTEVQNLDPQ